MANNKNLVIDLDCSLIRLDLFKESLGKSLLKQPVIFFKTVLLAINNRAKAKTLIAKYTEIDSQNLPYIREVLDTIDEYKSKGYNVYLVTGATASYANSIAEYLDIFDDVIATDENTNNIGNQKLEAIKQRIGNDFIYLADSKKDIPIWQHCKKAILVGKRSFIGNLKNNGVDIINIIESKKSILPTIIKQFRVHQWSKNLLLFVPALASHQLMVSGVFINALTGFIAFSLLASSIYVFNDIVDVDHDRKHPKKKIRPIAAGDLSIFSAYGIMLFCLLAGVFLSLNLGMMFLLVAGIYITLNLFYSLKLKRIIILDVIVLMFFYTLRLIAGHVPDAIPLSPWLLSFSIFLFFSLGLLKRYVDTIIIRENNASFLSGRGYSIDDGNMLMSLGVSSGLVSALVLILYTGSEQVQHFYATPMILVALAPIMLFWISRMWLMAERGLITSDPVLFALKDTSFYVVVFCFLSVMLISKYLVF